MSPDRLIYMANQIGKFFQSQGQDKAVPGIADHIKSSGTRGCARRSLRIWTAAAPGSTQRPRRARDAEEGRLTVTRGMPLTRLRSRAAGL
jgi:formate dehydrogenase subunit delta